MQVLGWMRRVALDSGWARKLIWEAMMPEGRRGVCPFSLLYSLTMKVQEP